MRIFSGLRKKFAPSGGESDDIRFSYRTTHAMDQMKETILLLRQQVEAMRLDKEQSIRHAANAGANEIAQLHDTVQALRDKLEATQIDKERSIQAAEASRSREIAQLKESVVALRLALERQKDP